MRPGESGTHRIPLHLSIIAMSYSGFRKVSVSD
jgi:hypothetical protein